LATLPRSQERDKIRFDLWHDHHCRGHHGDLTNAGTATTSGMGDSGAQVNAPSGSRVMFVEVNYLTKPLFGTWLTSPARIHYVATFIIRDRRDFSQIYNPSPTATRMTCDKYTA